MLASAIAAFFYLRVMVVMYMQEPEGDRPVESLGAFAGGVVALTAVATIVLGILWSPLIEAARDATLFFSSG
jgi:NADH-quinone oxidoreductase subunit N